MMIMCGGLTLLELFAIEFCELLGIHRSHVAGPDQRPVRIVPNRMANLILYIFVHVCGLGLFEKIHLFTGNFLAPVTIDVHHSPYSPKCDAISTPMFKYVNSLSLSNFMVDVERL